MYRQLQVDMIVSTLAQLVHRVQERFPGSGLSRVAVELHETARQTQARLVSVRRPNWWLRGSIVAGIVAILAIAVTAAIVLVRIARGSPDLADLLQGFDAAVNEIILIGAASYFLSSLERRMRRKRILQALHELRSIAHVIDAHQLTKDPEQVLSPDRTETLASPKRTMSRFELARYLDYCSEMLSLTAKLAALYAQCDSDPVVLSGVNDIESLAGNMSNKIWQKLTILDTALGPAKGR
jgi:hypothetical protein